MISVRFYFLMSQEYSTFIDDLFYHFFYLNLEQKEAFLSV